MLAEAGSQSINLLNHSPPFFYSKRRYFIEASHADLSKNSLFSTA